jgi:hypothetical protein
MRAHRLDFVVGGAQKAGTTTLDAYLRLHPSVGMAVRKELHFFDDERRDWLHPNYDELHALLPGGDLLRGEATPSTLYWTPALYRLAWYRPDVRLILIFRDPIDRAISHWRMRRHATRRGVGGDDEHLDLDDALRPGGRIRVLDEGLVPGLDRTRSYIERGFYGRQLNLLFSVFPREQVLLLDFDELKTRPMTLLGQVGSFLDIDPTAWRGQEPIRSQVSADEPPPGLRADLEAELVDLFAPDVALFRSLSGLHTPGWRRYQ